MPYVTWAQVADVAKGDARLAKMLLPHAETSADGDHDHFDEAVAAADRLVDVELERAGYIIPLDEPLTDPALARALVGIVIGIITEADSNREPWMERLEAYGRKYIKRIGDGDVRVLGAELSAEEDEFTAAIHASRADAPIFDIAQPDAAALDIYADLTTGYRRWRR